jgi:AAA+ ATPase superfamily predicted ATPase
VLIKKTPFVGRKKELKLLKDACKLGGARILVVYGRRRIGKTRLVEKFAEGKRFLYFAGESPNSLGAEKQHQIDKFTETVNKYFSISSNELIISWRKAFEFLSKQLTSDIPTVLMFDEVSWMGSGDDSFVGALKSWWDENINGNFSNLTLVISGSVSTWIEKNIIRSTALYGRITQQLELEPLSIPESIRFLRKLGHQTSTRSLLEILVVAGGIPWYLEQFRINASAEKNILRLFFTKNGLMFKEFDLVFHDLFNGESLINKQVLEFLIDGSRPIDSIASHIGWNLSDFDKLTEILNNLVISGFIRKSYQWSLKDGSSLRTYIYSINDCFSRFYLKYVEPEKDKINNGKNIYETISNLPAWATIKGLQLETLLLQNRYLINYFLDLSDSEVVNDGPFFQRLTKSQNGCQIDYLIQTKDQLLLCEFKFGKKKIGLEIIDEMKEKIIRLDAPEDFTKVAVLFYFGEIAKEVIESNYFFQIINLLDVCEEEDEF